VTERPHIDLLWPAAARRAAGLPSRLGRENVTFWEDICEVLLDPEPDRHAEETVRRWLRDQVAEELRERLGRANQGHLVEWARRLAPRMVWKLPRGHATPPARHHRRIVSVLLPHKLRALERELARLAFGWRLRPVAGGDSPEK
jgi:hypothetical protein